MPTTLIICPTFDHCETLLMSVASVRAQTDENWRMVIVCDGSPPRTIAIATALAEQDERIGFVVHPKGARYGEAYRDAVIREATEPYVCHLGDDDLWGSNHLAMMTRLLDVAELGLSATLRVTMKGPPQWAFANYATQAARDAVNGRRLNPSGINNVAYRREAYLRLPEGWSPAPPRFGSDVFMWRKFFAVPDLTVAATAEFGVIKYPAGMREEADWSGIERCAELGVMLARLNGERTFELIRERSVPLQCLMAGLRRERDLIAGIEDPGAAYRATGLDLASPDAPYNVATGDTLLAVPLTPVQREVADFAHLTMRAFGSADAPPANAVEAWTVRAKDDRRRARRMIQHLAVADKPGARRALAVLNRVFRDMRLPEEPAGQEPGRA